MAVPRILETNSFRGVSSVACPVSTLDPLAQVHRCLPYLTRDISELSAEDISGASEDQIVTIVARLEGEVFAS